MSKNIHKKAFTLAETLIALLIIGVVAAIIVPIVQYNYKVNALQTTFIDTMKEFNKGMSNYLASSFSYMKTEDDGTVSTVMPSMFDSKQALISLFAEENPMEKLSSQFHPTKTGTNCWGGLQISNNFDGTGTQTNLNNLRCFIDGDDIIYALEILDAGCENDLYNSDDEALQNIKKNKLRNSCGILYVDINGIKAPNSFGNDVFAFVITSAENNYLYPVGGNLMKAIDSGLLNGVGAFGNTCSPANKDGRACAGRIVEDGMKIKYMK